MDFKIKVNMKYNPLKVLALVSILFSAVIAQATAPSAFTNSSYAQEQDEDDSPSKSKTTLPIVTLNFSIIKKGRVRGTVSIVPILIITDPSEEEVSELKALTPLIQSDLMMVASLLAKKRFRINKPIDPNLVAKYFQSRLDKRIGVGRIKVYIQDAVIRPVR